MQFYFYFKFLLLFWFPINVFIGFVVLLSFCSLDSVAILVISLKFRHKTNMWHSNWHLFVVVVEVKIDLRLTTHTRTIAASQSLQLPGNNCSRLTVSVNCSRSACIRLYSRATEFWKRPFARKAICSKSGSEHPITNESIVVVASRSFISKLDHRAPLCGLTRRFEPFEPSIADRGIARPKKLNRIVGLRYRARESERRQWRQNGILTMIASPQSGTRKHTTWTVSSGFWEFKYPAFDLGVYRTNQRKKI